MSEASAKAFITDPAGSTSAQDVRDAIGTIYTDLSIPAWQDWAVVWSNNSTQPAIGNGVLIARYIQIGKLVTAEINLKFGTTTTGGTGGGWSWTLPVVQAARYATYGSFVGVGSAYLENAGMQGYGGVTVRLEPANVQMVFGGASGNLIDEGAPFAWGENDNFGMSFQYEAA